MSLSVDGFTRALAIGPGSDPDPAPGEPSRFAVVTLAEERGPRHGPA
jgi:hypothetical protein